MLSFELIRDYDMSFRFQLAFIISFLAIVSVDAQFTRQDTLRGSVTPERAWWDLTHYHLDIEVNPGDSTIVGSNTITYKVLNNHDVLQVDLQQPLRIVGATQDGKTLDIEREGSAHFIHLSSTQLPGTTRAIEVSYEGHPHVAIRAPWDGGVTWTTDDNGRPYVASSCQGIGASIWWPCKDHMYDEPDSMMISVTTPPGLMDVSNGQHVGTEEYPDGRRTFHWKVVNPINNYGVNLSIGDYVHFGEEYQGESGPLALDYYVLRDNLDRAKKQFEQVPMMMEAFEHWFGPYPFYKDGFKLVEVPYLGMEHQSAVTYGNGYMNGYRGRDLSNSGWGLKFDFIIIHEAGHEWFANNITYKDIADMWIHESFTAYSESLYVEYYHGKQAGADYVIGTRANISNDGPVIGTYNVNNRGSGDMYYKGSNLLHTLRQIVNDDVRWRDMLRGLNETFYHQTVTTEAIEDYMSEYLDMDLSAYFNQYLRTKDIPMLEYIYSNGGLMHRWTNAVAGLDIPVDIYVDGVHHRINVGRMWRALPLSSAPKEVKVDRDYFVGMLNTLGL